MAASYPTAVKVFTTKADGVDYPQAAHVNDLQDEVNAIEQVLSTSVNVSGGTLASIKFPAAQVASTDVNTLDDYEEGTWTITLTSAGGGAPTYTNRTGGYIKKGKEVTVSGILTLATLGTLAAGALSITGLPFTSENAGNYAGATIPYWANLNTTKVHVGGYVAPNTSEIILTALGAAAASTSTLTFGDLTATSEIIFSVTYRATT